MKSSIESLLWYVTVVMVGVFFFTGLALADEADIVFTNGKIYTVSKIHPYAEAVAVKDGKFLEVGSAKDIQESVGDRMVVLSDRERL